MNQMLNEKFPGGWSGGQLEQGSGFWGGYADQNAIKTEVQNALQKSLNNEKEYSFNFIIYPYFNFMW